MGGIGHGHTHANVYFDVYSQPDAPHAFFDAYSELDVDSASSDMDAYPPDSYAIAQQDACLAYSYA